MRRARQLRRSAIERSILAVMLATGGPLLPGVRANDVPLELRWEFDSGG